GRGGCPPGGPPPGSERPLTFSRRDPDAATQGATEWPFRGWGKQTRLLEVDAQLPRFQDRGNRRWYVNGQGQTFALVEGPVQFLMGSPLDEPDRDDVFETPHDRPIRHRFAIAAQAATVLHYQRFA